MQIKWLRTFNLFTNSYKKRLILLFALMVLAVLFEVLSIGSLLPLINFLVLESNKNEYLFNFFPNLENYHPNKIYIFITIIIFVFFLLRNIFFLFYTKIYISLDRQIER